ncbi:MAG: ABC transporter ATP-binding protein [Solibacillus sp.]|jgi:ABC-2 type transport system ATP-binding protein|uniref:ABC transporter ATP-binding protein n=1 Tax=unclassified Solibacillus TaxID=2637870 RepID=UPI0030F7C83F
MILCKGLEKKYGKKAILTDISFEIGEPKIVGLIGRNGVGKSTLLRLLAGYMKLSSGQLEVINQNPYQNLTVAANTIFIEETMTFPNVLTIGELINAAPKFYLNFEKELALKLLRYVGISERGYHYQLSKGQKAAFNLIYGLASRSAITLLDEPMNGLDEAIRDDMYRVILKEYIEYPRLIILSSHYLNELEHLIEDILLLHNGSVALFAPVEEVEQLAVKLIGQKDVMVPLVDQLGVLAINDNPPFYEVVVQQAPKELPHGIQQQALSASEVCKYITNEREGTVDDIYR